MALIICVLLFAAKGLALPATDLVVRSWSQGADVRQQSVGALLQTRDGYLWLGTARGLMRFDGVTFTAFTAENTPGAVDDYISAFSMWEDGTGTLWAGTESNGVIRNDHGHFSTLGKEQGLRGERVMRIDGDETGAVWIYTDAGVNRWRGGRFEEVHPERDGSAGSLAMLSSDRLTDDFQSMGLWRRTRYGLERFAYGHWNSFPTPPDEAKPFESDVRSIYEDTLHRVWYSLLSQAGRYFCACNGALRIYDGLPEGAFVSYEDKSGFLWLNSSSAHAARWKDGKVLSAERNSIPKVPSRCGTSGRYDLGRQYGNSAVSVSATTGSPRCLRPAYPSLVRFSSSKEVGRYGLAEQTFCIFSEARTTPRFSLSLQDPDPGSSSAPFLKM